MSRRIHATARPYFVTFHTTGRSLVMVSEDVQRLLDSYPALVATRNRVVLQRGAGRTTIEPATRGGGHAFEIER